jgi:ABC-type transporter Mla subunit MlaD
MSTIDERLERLVAITEYNVQQISGLRSTTETHSEQIAESTRQISDLRSSVASLVQIAARQGETLEVHRQTLEVHRQTLEVYRQNFEAVIARIDQNSAEIRGLQTENRRILDHLFGQQSN